MRSLCPHSRKVRFNDLPESFVGKKVGAARQPTMAVRKTFSRDDESPRRTHPQYTVVILNGT
jgi:hypothetical protein